MAYREIEVDEQDKNYEPKEFLKMKDLFQEVGDEFVGLYQKDGEGTYGREFSFKQKNGTIGILTVKGHLLKQLDKAAPFAVGERVKIIFDAEKDVVLQKGDDAGKTVTLKFFKIQVGTPNKKTDF
jgi:hypothetical protein